MATLPSRIAFQVASGTVIRMAEADNGSVKGDFELPEDTWTVARLNETIEATLEQAADRFPTYVVGEVSDVGHYDFGTFFELRDIEADAVISRSAAGVGLFTGFLVPNQDTYSPTVGGE